MANNNEKTQAFALKDIKEKKTTKKNKKKAKLGPNWFFIIVVLLVLIPCGVFGYILFDASQEGDVPILGDRFLIDLNPAIQEADIKDLKQDILALDNVEGVSVNCIVATLRVNVDAKDNMSREEVSRLAKNIYDLVDTKLPIGTYFTSTSTQKQYDLEINVYNDLSLEDGSFIMFNVVKNGPQEKYILQDVSKPLNEELAKELWEYVAKRDEQRQQENEDNQDDVVDDMYTEQEEADNAGTDAQ